MVNAPELLGSKGVRCILLPLVVKRGEKHQITGVPAIGTLQPTNHLTLVLLRGNSAAVRLTVVRPAGFRDHGALATGGRGDTSGLVLDIRGRVSGSLGGVKE